MIQTVLLPLALAAGTSTVRVLGGTHVPHAPTAEYLECVYFPTLRDLALDVEFGYNSAGFFPKGGGEVTVIKSVSGTPVRVRWNNKTSTSTSTFTFKSGTRLQLNGDLQETS